MVDRNGKEHKPKGVDGAGQFTGKGSENKGYNSAENIAVRVAGLVNKKINRKYRYNEFESKQEGNEFFQQESDKWLTINKDEVSAVNRYTGNSYRNINRYLRGDFVPNRETVKHDIVLIDKALSNFHLDNNIVLYRIQPELRDLQIGDIDTWKGFTSTSVSKDALGIDEVPNDDDFWNGGEVVYKILVPKGSRGAYVNSISNHKDNEFEYLLKRNTKAKVKNVIKEGKKKIIEWEVFDEDGKEY